MTLLSPNTHETVGEALRQHRDWLSARERLWTGQRAPNARQRMTALISRVQRITPPKPVFRFVIDAEIFDVKDLGMPDWRRIADEVLASREGITFMDLISPRRNKEIVAARHEVFYRCRVETALSLPQIGRRMGGKDHTTVLHGIRAHARRNGLPVPL